MDKNKKTVCANRLAEIRRKLEEQYVLDSTQQDCAYLLGMVDELQKAMQISWIVFAGEVSQKRAIELYEEFTKEFYQDVNKKP